MTSDRRRLLPAVGIGVYLVLALGTALTGYIWSNEAWFASPAFTLLHHGYLGTTILESKGTWMEGIDRHTYWIPPIHPLLQTLWYRIAGFGLLQMRFLSIMAGCIALLAWYQIIAMLSASRAVALTAILITGTDTRFLMFAALGRPDMICAAFGVAGWMVYLRWREKQLRRAIIASHCLAALACLTHPCGSLYAAGLLLLALYYDRRRIGWREAISIVPPYLAAACAWGIYILQAPSDFVRQLSGNVAGIGSEFTGVNRLAGLTSPLHALKAEYFLRYGFAFGRYGTKVEHIQLFALLIYTLAVVGCLLTPSIRKHSGYRALLLLGTLLYVTLGIVDGFKGSAYLLHTLPLCGALLAIYLSYVITKRRWFAIGAMVMFVAVEALGVEQSLTVTEQRWDYRNAVAFLRRAGSPSQIIGAGEFGFAFGFDSGMVDDIRLGYFSGRRPAFIVANIIYQGFYQQSARHEPEVHAFLAHMLRDEYRVAFHNSNYTIYQRIRAQ